MADITFPFSFSGTDVTSGSQIRTLLSDDSAPAASLSVLNGNIAASNFASNFDLEDIHTQRRSAVDAFGASANANVDYRSQMFGGFVHSTGERFQPSLLADERKVYIPGANVTRYFPWTTNIAIVTWTIYWNAQVPGVNISKIFFHIDGTVVQSEGRNVSFTSPVVTAGPPANIANYSKNYGFRKARAWHGHYVTPRSSLIAGGWHTLGLGIIADQQVQMTRVHARDIVVMAFKP